MIRMVLIALALSAVAGAARADPCTRIPDRGAMPTEVARGLTFDGPVVYVGDGDSLCVQTIPGIDGAGWVEVRLADFNAPELREPGGRAARAALVRLVLNRRVRCTAAGRTYDRVAAVCTLDHVGLGDQLRAAGVVEGGR